MLPKIEYQAPKLAGKLLPVVETLKIKHPKYAERLRAAADKAGVRIKDIQAGMGVTAEMARRYWHGIAKPTNEAARIKLARIVKATPAELEYGEAEITIKARQEPGVYKIDREAHDIAHAWSKLSDLKKQLYREAIFRDAAVENITPWLRFGRPSRSSYDDMERSIERAYHEHIKQLKLDI